MIVIKATRSDNNKLQTLVNDLGYVTMNKYGHLYCDIESINNNSVTVNSGYKDNSTKRVCLATDDVLFTDIPKYIIDKRINSTYRYKTCGGFSTINSTDYCAVGANVNLLSYTTLSPSFGTLSCVSTDTSDSSSGSGCTSVRLKYINSLGEQKEDTVSTTGTTPFNIGTNVREIIDFKCLTFGSNPPENHGDISLTNSDGKNVARIKTSFNNSLFFGIEIPINGYTLLRTLTVSSVENTNANVNVEIKLVIVEKRLTSPNYVYRFVFSQRCQFQKSITFDLSNFAPIYGLKDSNINFAIYPVFKSINDSNYNTSINAFLSAINVN